MVENIEKIKYICLNRNICINRKLDHVVDLLDFIRDGILMANNKKIEEDDNFKCWVNLPDQPPFLTLFSIIDGIPLRIVIANHLIKNIECRLDIGYEVK